MIRRANQSVLIERLAEKLKKEIKKPEWASFVKTGSFKERPPVDQDWWYMRAASILRKVCVQNPIGVAKLSTLYGGKKNRGYKPERYFKGSTNIIRTILQDLEKAELLKQDKKGAHKGRVPTKKALSMLSATEKEILKTEAPEKKPAPKTEKQPAKPAKESKPE